MAKNDNNWHKDSTPKKNITSEKASKINKRSHIGDSEASIKNTRKAAEIPPKKKKDK